MYENEKLMIGEHFTYKSIEWICLDVIDGNYLAMTAKPWQEMPFDIYDCNDWRKSSLRRILNNDFLDKVNKNHLVIQTSDLIADNGDKAYGTCGDYVTILSCDQYRKYRDIVPHYPEWMWTSTPWACNTDSANGVRVVYPETPRACNTNSANGVRVVDTTGDIYGSSAYISNGVAPVCLFSSKHLKLCRQTCLIEIDETAENEA